MSNSSSETDLPPQPLDQWFLDLLACPACEQHWPLHLSDSKQTLICGCGRHSFPIENGIPDLLVESATVIDPDKHPEDAPPESVKAQA